MEKSEISLVLMVDDCDREYKPSDTIRGTVKCKFLQPDDILGKVADVWVKLVGEEKTQCSEQGPENRTGNYIASNTFLSIPKCLSEEILDPTTYLFDYHLQLPKNIPSTFSNSRGSVKFFVRAIVHTKNAQGYEKEKEISVASPVDFSSHSVAKYKDPYVQKAEISIPYLFCLNMGTVSMEVHLSRRTLVQNETVMVRVSLINDSHTPVDVVVFNLEQTVTSKSARGRDSVVDHELLMIDTLEGVPAFARKPYDIFLTIPTSVKIPNFTMCRLISATYRIEVIASLRKPGDLVISIPVVLGHVPYWMDAGLNILQQRLPLPGDDPMCLPCLPPPSTVLPAGPTLYSPFKPGPIGFAVQNPFPSGQKVPSPNAHSEINLPASTTHQIRIPTCSSDAERVFPFSTSNHESESPPPSYESIYKQTGGVYSQDTARGISSISTSVSTSGAYPPMPLPPPDLYPPDIYQQSAGYSPMPLPPPDLPPPPRSSGHDAMPASNIAPDPIGRISSGHDDEPGASTPLLPSEEHAPSAPSQSE